MIDIYTSVISVRTPFKNNFEGGFSRKVKRMKFCILGQESFTHELDVLDILGKNVYVSVYYGFRGDFGEVKIE